MPNAVLHWLLGIAGAIIMLLLAGNGYWIKRLVDSIDKLRETVGKQQSLMEVQDAEFDACRNQCSANDKVMSDRLNEHSKTLKIHGEAIATIKARLKVPANEGE